MTSSSATAVQMPVPVPGTFLAGLDENSDRLVHSVQIDGVNGLQNISFIKLRKTHDSLGLHCDAPVNPATARYAE